MERCKIIIKIPLYQHQIRANYEKSNLLKISLGIV